VGSLALAAPSETVAVIIKQELLLPLWRNFVLEALSVIIQVASYKTRRKRVSRWRRLHHHFELAGWSDRRSLFDSGSGANLFALFALTTFESCGKRAHPTLAAAQSEFRGTMGFRWS